MTDPRAPNEWDQYWRAFPCTDVQARARVEREKRTVRWRGIAARVRSQFGSFDGLRVIELGAGAGDYSLLFQLEGSDTTLLDDSEPALKVAREQWSAFGLTPRYVLGGIFEAPARGLGDFDVALSVGAAEHFAPSDRVRAFRVHRDMVRHGGMVVVSVPNRHCFPYRLWRFLLETSGRWPYGRETTFTRGDLLNLAAEIGLEDAAVIGSSFLVDFERFTKLSLLTRNRYVRRRLPREWEESSPLDDHLGYALVLMGTRA